jgi:hypothetical protein
MGFKKDNQYGNDTKRGKGKNRKNYDAITLELLKFTKALYV